MPVSEHKAPVKPAEEQKTPRQLKPMISFKSLEELALEVEAEESERNEKISTLSQTSLVTIWKDYASTCESPSTRLLLEQISPTLKDKDIIAVTVKSQLAKGALIQETDLLDRIRKETHTEHIKLVIDVLPEPASENALPTRSSLSNAEKLNLMKEKNPLIEKLVKDLHLKPEE